MKIKNVVCAPGRTGFYFDDQRAIKRGAGHDGMFYIGQPVTEGFSAVRQAGEAISVMLILEDGQVAYGDCAAVQYSGAGGRDPLFLAKDFIPIIEQYIKPCLVGQEADNFRALAARMEAIEVGGKRLHTAIRYGVSQALLDAVAKASGRMMCEVVADEYGCTVSDHLIPIFTQSGDDRYDNADKMIIKGAQVLPHALINNVETKLGAHGEKLQEYVRGFATGSWRSVWTSTMPRSCISMSTVRSAQPSAIITMQPWRIIWRSWSRPQSRSTCGSKDRWTATVTAKRRWRRSRG